MNYDNQRLMEIQQLKKGYQHKMLEAETMSEAFEFQDKWNALDEEEKQILDRFGVEV